MSYPKKDKKEDFRLQFEKWEREQEEKKRKAWEDFEKLSSQAKIEHLWKHIYELEQNIQLLEDELDVHQRCTAAPEKPEEWIVDVDSRAEELEKLASLRYFGSGYARFNQSPSVRITASEALANAAVRGQAIKALAYALVEIAGSAPAHGAAADPRLVEAYDKALRKLTGEKSEARDARGTSSFWMGYWKQHGEDILAKEKQAREEEPPPRPANLPKDIFDR